MQIEQVLQHYDTSLERSIKTRFQIRTETNNQLSDLGVESTTLLCFDIWTLLCLIVYQEKHRKASLTAWRRIL
uniref:Auxin response factor n=1 Tax=Rhizophora mucronata TaxID=61149 RepID=A0A2P2ITA7_RHIMU